MARLSAALNDIDDIDVRTGDGPGPVVNERFDLIVCNPPFVISPDSELVFRDGGAGGDELSRAMVRDVVPLLQPGGVACLLVNWIVRDRTATNAAPERWLANLEVDALLLQHDELAPLAYAERWSMLPGGASIEDHEATTERWLAEFDRLGARAIASGAIVLRRSGSGSRVRVMRMPKRPSNGGQQVQRMLDGSGRFEGTDDPALSQARFRLVHGHRIDQRLRYGHGSYQAAAATMRLEHAAGVVGSIPADCLEAVFLIDGQASLAAIAAEVAAGRGVEDVSEFEASLRPVLLELYESGFLEVVEDS
jgi:hypothetical protein